MSLIGVAVGGGLTLLSRLFGEYYIAKREHIKWKREKRAEIAEESLKIYNELYTYLSFSSLAKDHPEISEFIAKVNFQDLLVKSRRLSSRLPLYFSEEISTLWFELITMIQGAVDGKFALEMVKAQKGEELSKEAEEFGEKLFRLYELFKEELNKK